MTRKYDSGRRRQSGRRRSPYQQALDGEQVAGDGGGQGEFVKRDAVGGDGDAENARTVGRLDATGRIFQHDGVAGCRSSASENFQNQVGMRLATRHVVNADDGAEVACQAEARQARADVRARPRGRHRQEIATRPQRLQQRDQPRHRAQVGFGQRPHPLVTHRRQMLIPVISHEYHDLVDQVEGRVHASVSVARPADDHDRELVRSQLSRALGKDVGPHFHVNPAILGGVIVRVGDTVLDGSVRRRMATLRARMVGGAR